LCDYFFRSHESGWIDRWTLKAACAAERESANGIIVQQIGVRKVPH
jgi:hypothetical protein